MQLRDLRSMEDRWGMRESPKYIETVKKKKKLFQNLRSHSIKGNKTCVTKLCLKVKLYQKSPGWVSSSLWTLISYLKNEGPFCVPFFTQQFCDCSVLGKKHVQPIRVLLSLVPEIVFLLHQLHFCWWRCMCWGFSSVHRATVIWWLTRAILCWLREFSFNSM